MTKENLFLFAFPSAAYLIYKIYIFFEYVSIFHRNDVSCIYRYYWSESEISVIACTYGFATDKVLAAVLMVMTPSQSSYAQSSTTAKRCEATTKKGTRCKNTAVNNTKYCQVHQAKSPNVQQCKAMTKSGSRCSIGAKTSGYCKQHYQMPLEGKL